MQEVLTDLPSREDFSTAVNSGFYVVREEGASVELTLLECNSVVSNESQECYTLLFRGPLDHPAEQATYQLENDRFGKFQLFLVPIKRDDQGLYFEAVVNHLLKR